jgi:hypothetical protein
VDEGEIVKVGVNVKVGVACTGWVGVGRKNITTLEIHETAVQEIRASVINPKNSRPVIVRFFHVSIREYFVIIFVG